MVEDKATGLMLPEGTREKVREVWTFDDEIKHLKRAEKSMTKRKIGIMLVCQECGKSVVFSADAESMTEIKMECDCKRRVVVN